MATATRLGFLDLLQFALANILVFNKIKKTAGLDHVVLGISGGGKLSKEVCVFIRALGIQLAEGYGLTETSPVINFNEPEFATSFDISKAKRDLGYAPKVDLDEGLKRTGEWYRAEGYI